MKNQLDVPPELSHLLEKREGGDRRGQVEAQPPKDRAAGQLPETAARKPPVERRRRSRRKS